MSTLQVKRGSLSSIPTLADGEFGWCKDTKQLYIGNNSKKILINGDINKTYGVKINRANSNPSTSVIYTDDAVGFQNSTCDPWHGFRDAGWSERFPFNNIRACLLKDGVVQGYLDTNDFSKWEDGHLPYPDITSGAGGDVMIEYPRGFYKITQDNQNTYIQISNNSREVNNGFTDYAFSYNGEVKSKFYVGAYLGYIDGSNKLRSLSGVMPYYGKTIAQMRTSAQLNGSGYEMLSYNKIIWLQILYLIRFKNLNCQHELGIDNTKSGAMNNTGVTNKDGMNGGWKDPPTSTHHASTKCNGVENPWGNIQTFIDGFITKSGRFLISDGNFNDSGTGYEDIGGMATTPSSTGFVKSIIGSNKGAFISQDASGSETTYFSDKSDYEYNASTPIFGGDTRSQGQAGIFSMNCRNLSIPEYGARLMYCGGL